MSGMRLVFATAPGITAAVSVGLSGCAVYGADRYTEPAYYGNNYSYRGAHGDSACGNTSVFRCGYYGDPIAGYGYGYSHLHSGWDDGFHGHFGSAYDIPALRHAPELGYRHLGHLHEAPDHGHVGREHVGTSQRSSQTPRNTSSHRFGPGHHLGTHH